VTFTWQDYLTTNQNSTNNTTHEQPGQAARGYHLQVATSPTFTTLIDDVTVDQTTYTAYSKTYPEGLLYWRIQAIDGSGNGLAWSDPIPFTKTSPPVHPVSPINGATVSGTKPFEWTPLDFAASYDLEVYKNNDRTASSTNRVISVSSQQIAYTTPTALPVTGSPYAWRVRRVDADGKKGAWSTWSTFRVSGSAPQVVSPEDGTYVSGTDALFTWKAVTGAGSYRFERRAPAGTFNYETVTTVGLAWAPSKKISDGSWEWRITALDAGNQPMASSPWRAFRVDSVAPTVVSTSPSTTAKPGANFVAKFSEPVRNVTGSTMKLYVKGRVHPLTASVTLGSLRQTATLNPGANLIVGKRYTVRLTAGITDQSGRGLTAMSWQVTAVR
jgi:hypothetical protein